MTDELRMMLDVRAEAICAPCHLRHDARYKVTKRKARRLP
jgi:hypothetical protein